MKGIKKSKHQTVNHKLTQVLDQLEPLVSSAKAALYKNQNRDNWFSAYKAEVKLAPLKS